MAKQATRYYKVNPWKIIEEGFDKERSMVSESIFSLANEYMGSRGNFEEGFSGNTLVGNYFNGLYEVPDKQEQGGYLGISKKNHYMVNSVNGFYTRIYVDGKLIDLNNSDFSNFKRELDLKTGLLTRSYIFENKVKITFQKLISLKRYHNAYSTLKIEALIDNVNIKVISGFDYSIVHFGKFAYWHIIDHKEDENTGFIKAITKNTKMELLTTYEFINNSNVEMKPYNDDLLIGREIEINLNNQETFELEKRIANYNLHKEKINESEEINKKIISFEDALAENTEFLTDFFETSDIEIDGDEVNQQGIRYSMFQLISTYQGLNLNNNIGAKGLTGEAYSGHAFWDTETYCLPFYLFNNPKSAKDLLMFRYQTLENAKARAKELDCVGACYPIATLNGDEACNLWQHASLQFQPTSGVAYAIYHYVNVTGDTDFLKNYGIEMLIEISRFFASRGDYNADHSAYGYYGVMGPDEFQMMVNHNTYTNYMAKRSFEYTISALKFLEENDRKAYNAILEKEKLDASEVTVWQDMIDKMKILYSDETKLFEQHAGYYDLPHIDIKKIPVTDFPLYAHWSYDHLYRNDMIKQPDVLMMMFLYNQSFTEEQKLKNYEFYEPRTIHESSLSPSVHSILALELGKEKEGLDFFGFATRMDLDDYNRNTCEGLHLTSICAAWLNIVYGFGGLRSDGNILVLKPVLPSNWNSYKFKFKYATSNILVNVERDRVTIDSSKEVKIKLYDQEINIKGRYIWKK